MPAILYGHGEDCVGLAAKREDVEAAIRHGSRIVELKGAVKTGALIRELQWDTFGVEPLHVDFLRVSATERVKVKVPVELKGDCPGQRAGGTVNLVLHEIEIRVQCRPCAGTGLRSDRAASRSVTCVKVSDLELPEGATAVLDGEETVVTCTMAGRQGRRRSRRGLPPSRK